MKRLLSLFLALVMLLSLVPATVLSAAVNGNKVSYELSNPFTDVKEDDWFYDAVQYARINGFFRGTSDTTFDPNGTMTRGMFVTVLGRMAGVDTANYSGENPFKDVPADMYYAPYVTWAAKHGVTEGTGNGLFSPDTLINREQMATFLVRYFENFSVDCNTDEKIDGYPADISEVSSWAQKAVYTLWQQGLLIGDGVNFNPHDKATRAETATIAQRTDEVVEVWFKVPGLRSDRVRINPETGLPYEEKEEKNPTTRPGVSDTIVITGSNQCSVKFFDGDRLIENKIVAKEGVLDSLPGTEKTSKASGVFEGWYADPEFTQLFDATAPIMSHTNVYAKYSELGTAELTITSFAQMDIEEDVIFTVKGEGDISAIKLVPKDGSDNIELVITPTSDGYTVTAKDGFNPGSSYELTIPEGMSFVGSNGDTLPDTVRTASFSIEKEEVENLEMSDLTRYVQNDNPAALQAGSTVTVPDAKVGDLICFYHTTNPEDRDYSSVSYVNDPETWFKVAAVDGDTVVLADLEESDTEKLYDIPDNFPIIGDISAIDGTLTLEDDADGYKLDEEIYSMMMASEPDITPDLAYAKTKISVGDFISIYASADGVESEADVYFGKVTGYNEADGTLTYELSSAEEIENAVDLYTKPVIEGDDLISEEEEEELERTLLAQVERSGFAEEAAFILADLATKTDGFRNMDGVQVLLKDENGNTLSDEEIALLNLGATFELSDDVNLTVEIITSGDQLHFEDKGSVQLAIGIDAQFEVEVEDDGKVSIDLSATFVQEMAMGLSLNGSLVWKKVLGFIPVPLGVKMGATFDLYSYTGIRVDVQAYTVAPEDESLFDQFKDVINNPEKIAELLPDNEKFAAIKEGFETVGDVFDKIEEIEGELAQLESDAEQAIAYANDLATLWDAVDAMDTDGKYTKEDWKNLGETFGKTNVSKDLMDMLNLSTETELDADRYAESLEDLLSKYSEMLEKETDWVTLVEQEMGRFEANYYGLVLYMQADFLVHADLNIAMGANLQYEVGKRYNFWIKVGLFTPEAGSTTMDLVDEQFAFQFYVMGKLGLKLGIKGTVGFAIGSADIANVGLSLEIGPYIKLYGFFIYEYERMRAANTDKWISDSRMAGALYLDFGLYLVASVSAEALNTFEVSYDFVDEEFPLLEAGEKKYPYAFHYELEDDELVLIVDDDGYISTEASMMLPDDYRAVSYCNLVSGYMGASVFDWDNYNVYLSNPAFTMDKNGVITVKIPEDVRYLESDLVLTYKYGKMAFSTYDMQITLPLVWTNLSIDELTQYYTANVRVGNNLDGYDIVWSQKVRKEEEFTLPTEDELKELIGYDEAIYSSISFPDAGRVTSIIQNTNYDCTVEYTQYAVTVDNIENIDGTTESRTFYTTYGNTFDFSDLEATGTQANSIYNKFAGVTTSATVTANKQEQVIDLTQPIKGAVAEKIMSGITATANYVDNSAIVTYVFAGVDLEPVTEIINKGGTPTYDVFGAVAYQGMSIKSITPELGVVNGNTTYFVDCGDIKGESYTITFDEKGGTDVEDITRVGGSLIGLLPTPTREHYNFAGWYTDEALTTQFDERLMPETDVTVYAKWTLKPYTVSFNVNGGDSWAAGEGTKTVYYGETYGTLPKPTRALYRFDGWFTDTEFTTQITENDVVSFTGEQTLFAKWTELVQIEEAFLYEPYNRGVYSKGVEHEVLPLQYPTTPEGGPEVTEDSFTFKFMRQGNNEYEEGYPINAGTYDVTITRPADDYYAAFSQTLTAVFTVNKTSRSVNAGGALEIADVGYTYAVLRIPEADNVIDDLDENATIYFELVPNDGSSNLVAGYAEGPWKEAVRVDGLKPGTGYNLNISVRNDSNYYNENCRKYGVVESTLAIPDTIWTDYAEPIEIVSGQSEYVITTAGQLAWLAKETNAGRLPTTNKTFKLGADIDLTGHKWVPIGKNMVSSFRGNFDGNGYKISGLVINSSDDYTGLFGMVGLNSGHTICNVTITDGYIKSSSGDAIGSIIGFAYGSDPNPVVVKNCISYATVIGYNCVGGIVGDSLWGSVDNCVNYGYVSGNDCVGGILGLTDDSSHLTHGNVIDSVNYGEVDGWCHVGGVAGYVNVGRILNSANFGEVYASGDCAGGITGAHSDSKNAKTMNCINYTKVWSYEASYTGAVIGRNTKDKGYVGPVYYNKNTCSYKAAGTDGGSSDSVDNLDAHSFTDSNSLTVMSNLNDWSGFSTYGASEWVKANDRNGFIPESVFEMLEERK